MVNEPIRDRNFCLSLILFYINSSATYNLEQTSMVKSLIGYAEHGWKYPISLSAALTPSDCGLCHTSPSKSKLRQNPHAPLLQWLSGATPAFSKDTTTVSVAFAKRKETYARNNRESCKRMGARFTKWFSRSIWELPLSYQGMGRR